MWNGRPGREITRSLRVPRNTEGLLALTLVITLCYKSHSRTSYHLRACAPVFRSSSMAEHSAVNRRVVGSSPTCGAILIINRMNNGQLIIVINCFTEMTR